MTTDNTLAFVFPGQGSQAIGMLADVAEKSDIVKQTFDEASEALGYDLWALVQNGPEEDLGKTEKTQPALLTAGIALWRVWQSKSDVMPGFLAGHSLGEYTALVAAGVIDFKDAVKLVELRGQFMQEAVPAGKGGMAAIIGLADQDIIDACKQAEEGQVVSAVNFNSPGQVVIAGEKDAVDRAMAICKEKGAKRALPLAVSAPSHCALMKPAADKLAEKLKSIQLNEPTIPVVQNTIASVEGNLDVLIKNLIEQLYQPVLWADSVAYLAEQGVLTTVECGPGKVLSGLNKRIHKPLTCQFLGQWAGFEKALG